MKPCGTTPRLQPCPFCGGEGRIHWSGDQEIVNVRCVNWAPGICLGAGANCYEEPEAIAAWNRRGTQSETLFRDAKMGATLNEDGSVTPARPVKPSAAASTYWLIESDSFEPRRYWTCDQRRTGDDVSPMVWETDSSKAVRYATREEAMRTIMMLQEECGAYEHMDCAGPEPVLDKPAQIGSTRFGVGVKWSTVIDRAQREYEYQSGRTECIVPSATASATDPVAEALKLYPDRAEHHEARAEDKKTRRP